MGAGRRFVRPAVRAAFGAGVAFGQAGCGDEPTIATAPFVVEASLAAPPSATVGRPLALAPTFIVRNASGSVLANTPVTVAVTAGNGTLQNVPARTGTGPTSVGDWTLDTLVGLNAVTILAGSAPPVVIEVIGVPDAPAAIRVSGGDQYGLAGDLLDHPLRVDVVDRYGNPINGVALDLSVAEGEGAITPAVPGEVTSPAELHWRLGRKGGTQRVLVRAAGLQATVGAAIRSDYAPVVRFVGANPSAAVQAAFAKAAERVHAIVTGDVQDIPIFNFDLARCGVQLPALTEVIDDVVIFAIVGQMDGVGNVLASAGACITRTQSRHAVIGVMRFDADDVPELEANGRLEAVVLHEMLHVLGIGSTWRIRGMLAGSGTSDPRFTGSQAAGQCQAAGGILACADHQVPVENIGGSGTAEVHWRESVFDNEVMTGFVEDGSDMPLSGMTVASLEDIGYTVNLFAADPYHLPVSATFAPRIVPSSVAPWEAVTPPLFEVTPAGWIRPLVIAPGT